MKTTAFRVAIDAALDNKVSVKNAVSVYHTTYEQHKNMKHFTFRFLNASGEEVTRGTAQAEDRDEMYKLIMKYFGRLLDNPNYSLEIQELTTECKQLNEIEQIPERTRIAFRAAFNASMDERVAVKDAVAVYNAVYEHTKEEYDNKKEIIECSQILS